LNPANKGVIERNTDVDVFSFVTGTGPIDLAVNPWIMPSGGTRGGDLDVLLELSDQNGVLVATNNPASQTTARIQTSLTDGIYYLYVRNAGTGDPMSSSPTGYTPYASIGQYFITGTVVPSGFVVPPQAALQVTDIAQSGVGAKQLTVTYTDNVAIDVSTISEDDVRVTGPNGYVRAARLVSISSLTNGTPRVATYEVDPPSGPVWTERDAGAYTIWMETNQVSDTEGAWVAAGQLGQFNASIPRSIYVADMNADPLWTLEPLWQYGPPAYGATGPTNGFTGTNIIAYNLNGNYENKLSMKYATTPAINCSGASTLTLRFQRWLRLKKNDTANIQVSTNGTAWTDVWSTKNAISDSTWQEVQYALPSWVDGSPSLRLRWGIASDNAQNEIGWNLDDVEIIAGTALDTAPPSALLSATDITTGGSPFYTFTVTYTDNTAVRLASLNSSNLFVIGPNDFSNLVQFVGADIASNGTPCTASYSLDAPGGIWDAADNGSYQIVLQDGEVSDTYGNVMGGTVLGTFSVAVPTNLQAILVEPTLLTVVEGSNAAFTIRLAESVATNVVVTVGRISGDTDLVGPSGPLIFNSANWSNPVPVMVSALPDADQENGSAIFECSAANVQPVTVTAVESDTTPDAVLTVACNNPDWGTVSPTGGVFRVGSSVELLAVPAAYYRFAEWTGDRPGTDDPLTVVLNTNVTVEAMFAELLTANYSVPLWWLAAHGYTNDFETVVTLVGANGIPVWQSYVAGLDPNDPNSQLRLRLDPSADGAEWVLSWNAITGRLYTVFSSANPVTGYAPMAGATQLPESIHSLTNAADESSPTRFYRLEVQKP
jgi:hypothetical protein